VLGDTLWVADIDVVRAFNARTGAPVDSVKLDSLGAVFLNDIAIASQRRDLHHRHRHSLRDVGNVLHPGPDRIFRVGPDRKVTVAVRVTHSAGRNGITLDAVGRRFIVVQYGGKAVMAWKPGDRAPSVIARGVGGFDGVEMIGGKVVVSSWTDSSITRFDSTQGTKIISGVPSPADFGYDAKRNRVLIPILTGIAWRFAAAVVLTPDPLSVPERGTKGEIKAAALVASDSGSFRGPTPGPPHDPDDRAIAKQLARIPRAIRSLGSLNVGTSTAALEM